jgi:hypothetical protein
MMVLFLVGLVSMILMRTLRKDYARYSREDDVDEMVHMYLYLLTIRHITESHATECCHGNVCVGEGPGR